MDITPDELIIRYELHIIPGLAIFNYMHFNYLK